MVPGLYDEKMLRLRSLRDALCCGCDTFVGQVEMAGADFFVGG
jgi:hypothetical protein